MVVLLEKSALRVSQVEPFSPVGVVARGGDVWLPPLNFVCLWLPLFGG